MATNNWYVLTGGPSTGKTTLLSELEKLGHQTVRETARMLIDQAIANGMTASQLRRDEKHFQKNVAITKEKAERNADPNMLTFFDRGMHDSLAYCRYYGFDVEPWMETLLQTSTYRKVFLLEPLPVFEYDNVRIENADFVEKMHGLLHDAYAEFGMQPIVIKAAPVADRLKMILSHIKN